VEHDDRQVPQRALQRARQVALAAAAVRPQDALQAPSEICALSSAQRVTAFGRRPGAAVSRAVHARPLDAEGRQDEPNVALLDTSADGSAPAPIVLTMPPEPFEIMGVVNVTPDSFSDGGEWFDRDAAVTHGLQLAAEGATILDIGGESTRPRSLPVPEEEELRRTEPVVRALARTGATVSIDTVKLAVAEAALDAGASYINDVTAFRAAPDMAGLTADRRARCCLMHMLGEPRTMQEDPRYADVVDEVKAFLLDRAEFAVREGVKEDKIDLDPGIGFGKTLAHNLELLARTDELVALGFRVVIGVSRKSFIHKLADVPDPLRRVPGTIAANVLAYERGARVFRVHDVAESHQALTVASATLQRDGA
jgi:dihydropteroate synthase